MTPAGRIWSYSLWQSDNDWIWQIWWSTTHVSPLTGEIWCSQCSSILKSQMKIFQWTSNRLSEQSCGNQGAISKITTPEALEMSKYNPIISQAEHLNRITPNHHVFQTFPAISSKAPKSQITKLSAVRLCDILSNLTEYYNILSRLQLQWQCRWRKKKLIMKYLPHPEKAVVALLINLVSVIVLLKRHISRIKSQPESELYM